MATMFVAVVSVEKTRVARIGNILPAASPTNVTVRPAAVTILMLPAPPIYSERALIAPVSLGVTATAS